MRRFPLIARTELSELIQVVVASVPSILPSSIIVPSFVTKTELPIVILPALMLKTAVEETDLFPEGIVNPPTTVPTPSISISIPSRVSTFALPPLYVPFIIKSPCTLKGRLL